MDKNGMYHDVNVNNIGENHTDAKKKDDPTADVKYFFSDPFKLDGHGKKKRRHCNICRWVFLSFIFYFFSFMPGNGTKMCRVALVMIVRHFVGIYKPIIG